MRAEECTVSFYRYLYETVGTPWLWYRAPAARRRALAAQIRKETTEIFVLYVGGVPAGYFELDTAAPDETELCYFGLIPGIHRPPSRPVSVAGGDRPGLVATDPAALGAHAQLRPPEGARPLSARRVSSSMTAGSCASRTPAPTASCRAICPIHGCRRSPEYAYPRSMPPVAFSTAATRRFEKASISASVSVASCGCSVTAIASDFLPSGRPLPS